MNRSGREAAAGTRNVLQPNADSLQWAEWDAVGGALTAIGIGRGGHLPVLRAAPSDARAVAELLRTNADGTPNLEVEILEDSRRPVSAVEVVRAVANLLQKERERAVIYFSGHAVA